MTNTAAASINHQPPAASSNARKETLRGTRPGPDKVRGWVGHKRENVVVCKRRNRKKICLNDGLRHRLATSTRAVSTEKGVAAAGLGNTVE